MAVKKTVSDVMEQEKAVDSYRLKYLMNVRKEPSLYSDKICTKEAGTLVSVEALEGDWLHLTDGTYILYENGRYAEKL